MPRAVAWPMLLRPPLRCFPSVSALTGLPFHRLDRSISTRPRWAGLVGLYCFSAIFLERSEEHTSELQSLMRILYAVLCLQKQNITKYEQKSRNTNRNNTY